MCDKEAWNTYRITAYSHQVGIDPRATGGIHDHEVRLGPAGWQRRISDSNGSFCSAGPVTAIDDAEGEALYEEAGKTHVC